MGNSPFQPGGRSARRRAIRARTIAAQVLAALALAAPAAHADEPAQQPGAPAPSDAPPPEQVAALSRPPGNSVHLFGTAAIGKGLRFNNPYRLATQLGPTPESVSLTATYFDLGLAFAIGAPDGLKHGAAVHLSFALAGVPQVVLTPTYLLAYRGPHRFLAYGRLGPSVILTPDATVGGEIAGGFGFFVTSRVAIASELVFDVYYGAGTHDTGVATYPILSGQLGLLVDYEVLP